MFMLRMWCIIGYRKAKRARRGNGGQCLCQNIYVFLIGFEYVAPPVPPTAHTCCKRPTTSPAEVVCVSPWMCFLRRTVVPLPLVRHQVFEGAQTRGRALGAWYFGVKHSSSHLTKSFGRFSCYF